jgi:hypothetical protein
METKRKRKRKRYGNDERPLLTLANEMKCKRNGNETQTKCKRNGNEMQMKCKRNANETLKRAFKRLQYCMYVVYCVSRV